MIPRRVTHDRRTDHIDPLVRIPRLTGFIHVDRKMTDAEAEKLRAAWVRRLGSQVSLLIDPPDPIRREKRGA